MNSTAKGFSLVEFSQGEDSLTSRMLFPEGTCCIFFMGTGNFLVGWFSLGENSLVG